VKIATTYRCLDAVVEIETSDPVLAALIDELFGVMAVSDPPTVRCALVEQARTYVIAVDGDSVVTTDSPAYAFAHLMWEVNRAAIAATTTDLLLHAAAATHDRGAVLVGGTSGSGKSTLVAALVGSGLGYVTDDVLPVDGLGRVVPYPKPIGLGEDAASLFATLRALRPEYRPYMGEEWFVAPAMLGGTYGRVTPLTLVVLPRYEPGAATSVTAMSRAEALVALAGGSFNFARLGNDAFARVAVLLGESECYRIVGSDVDEMVTFVLSALSSEREEIA
jgi:hypothetical protein